MHAVKAYEQMDIDLHSFVTSTLDEGEWSVSQPGRFILRGPAQGNLRTGGGVGHGASTDILEKKQILSHGGNRTTVSRSSNPYPADSTDWTSPARSLIVSISLEVFSRAKYKERIINNNHYYS